MLVAAQQPTRRGMTRALFALLTVTVVALSTVNLPAHGSEPLVRLETSMGNITLKLYLEKGATQRG